MNILRVALSTKKSFCAALAQKTLDKCGIAPKYHQAGILHGFISHQPKVIVC